MWLTGSILVDWGSHPTTRSTGGYDLSFRTRLVNEFSTLIVKSEAHQILTAYHVIIAVAEACNSYLNGGGDSSPKALYHRQRTLTLVGERLAGKDALSDSTLGVIVMMIVQEQMRKVVPEAHIHYEGLRRLVEARGGLEQLEQSPTLLLKICK